MITPAQLQTDLDFACNVLSGLATLAPSSMNLPAYVIAMQGVLDNPTILLLLSTWIDSLQPAPVPTLPPIGANGIV